MTIHVNVPVRPILRLALKGRVSWRNLVADVLRSLFGRMVAA